MKTVHVTSHNLVEQLDAATVRQARLLRAKGIDPHLAVIAVGAAARSSYIRTKQKRGHELGIEVSVYQLPDSVTYGDIESVINFVNDDSGVSGAIIQLPLPASISSANRDRLLAGVAAIKDVDALSMGCHIKPGATIDQIIKQAAGAQRFVPTTAAAMLLLAQHEKLDLHKSVVVVGKGVLVGNPLHAILTAMKIPHIWVDKNSKGYMDAIKGADIVLAGTDATQPFLNKKTVKQGAAVLAAGSEIDHESLKGHAALISAKVGSIGPLTVSLLLRNTLNATLWQQKS